MMSGNGPYPTSIWLELVAESLVGFVKGVLGLV